MLESAPGAAAAALRGPERWPCGPCGPYSQLRGRSAPRARPGGGRACPARRRMCVVYTHRMRPLRTERIRGSKGPEAARGGGRGAVRGPRPDDVLMPCRAAGSTQWRRQGGGSRRVPCGRVRQARLVSELVPQTRQGGGMNTNKHTRFYHGYGHRTSLFGHTRGRNGRQLATVLCTQLVTGRLVHTPCSDGGGGSEARKRLQLHPQALCGRTYDGREGVA